jgi:large conductance mechanosensitive channel
MWKGFREFIARGNVLDLAIAVILGAAFATVVKSLVDDIIMPPLGLALGKVDFTNLFFVLSDGAKAAGPYATLADAKAAGAVTVNYGLFLNSVVAFLLVGFSCYLMVRQVQRFLTKPVSVPANTKPCPECAMAIPLPAKRCPHCTSVVIGG